MTGMRRECCEVWCTCCKGWGQTESSGTPLERGYGGDAKPETRTEKGRDVKKVLNHARAESVIPNQDEIYGGGELSGLWCQRQQKGRAGRGRRLVDGLLL